MESFYLGLAGAFIGGLMLSLTVYFIFLFEKRETNKLADKLSHELRNMYTNRILNTQSNNAGKYN